MGTTDMLDAGVVVFPAIQKVECYTDVLQTELGAL
jgi:hypothetical protein